MIISLRLVLRVAISIYDHTWSAQARNAEPIDLDQLYRCLLRWIQPGQLDQAGTAAAGDQPTTAGRLVGRPDVAQQWALLLLAGHDDAGRAELADGHRHRLVEGPAGTAGPAGHDHVQADVPGLAQVLLQQGHRVAAGAGDQVVVVDQHVQLGAAPPAAVAQLRG